MHLRKWQLSDIEFVVNLRNRKDLQKWFRQDRDLTLDDQADFMLSHPEYNAFIVSEEGQDVGVIALNGEELCIAAPLEYHARAIEALEKQEKPRRMFGEVFSENPALPIYLHECNFKPTRYLCNRYTKQGKSIDAVLIEKLCEY